MKRRVSMIAAVAENGVIGRAGGLPWSIPEDSRFYWQKVTGQIIILGRHCFGEVDHPAALTIVLSRNPAFEPPPFKSGGRRCMVARSFNEALTLAQEFRADDITSDQAGAAPGAPEKEILVCGGPRVYEEAMTAASRLYLTHVHASVQGDTYFPHDWRDHFPRLVSERESRSSSYRYTFCIYEK